jgi:chemotaxis family two-component system sensor kinase Cph1
MDNKLPEEIIEVPVSFPLDSEECARIPISFITSVQPHGYLLVLDRENMTIRQVSANLPAALGLTTSDLLEKPLAHFVMAQALEEIRNNTAAAGAGNSIPFTLWFSTRSRTLQCLAVLHFHPDYLLLELEEQRVQEAAPSFVNVYQQVKQVLGLISASVTTHQMLQAAAEEIKKLSGFDRVMLYRFDRDWNGTVMGEALEPGMEPYLDLRFPASDIPRQARELYLRTPYRCIPDARYQAIPLVPELNPLTHQPTDLSDCLLRGVPPVHLEYLQNMEVGASMSASIIKDGQLWGLISCHHRQPKYLPYELRSAFELLANIISSQLTVRESRFTMQRKTELSELHARLLEQMTSANNFVQGLSGSSPNLLDYLGLSGAVFVEEGNFTTLGETPSEEESRALIAWLREQADVQLFSTDGLPGIYPPAEQFRLKASGLIALPLSKEGNVWVLGFRPEVIQLVKWGGNPNEHVQVTQEQGVRQLHPRNSFAQWKETVRGTSEPWEFWELEAAGILRNSILEVILKMQILKRLIAEEEVYKLSVVAAKTDNAVLILGRNGTVEWLNEAFTRYTGLTLSDAAGRSLRDLTSSVRSLQEIGELISEANYRSESFSKDISIERDNKRFYISFNFTPISTPGSSLDRFVGIGSDVTPMREYSKQLERINKELDKFAFVVAHDLKAPLHSIQSLVNALQGNVTGNDHHDSSELLGYLERSVDRMHTLITDVLSYSRIGRIEMEQEAVDLRQVFTEVLEWLHPDDRIEVRLPAQLPVLQEVKVDLQQIISNLLSNAIKYGCREEGCLITITYERLPAEHLFSIQDNGRGIETDQQERIFEMFQTLPTSAKQERGTGIGLATVKKLVEEKGGRIWVESEPGKGAAFWFTLPLSAEEQQG